MDDKLNAAEDPALCLSMDAMSATTRGHYSEWNSRHQQLLDNDAYLQKQLENVTQGNNNLQEELTEKLEEVKEQVADADAALGELFPDLTAPTEADAGKSLQVTVDGKAAWSKDSSASWQTLFPDMCLFGTTTFSDNNNHAEEVYTNGYRKTTDFDTDGSAIERLYDPDGNLVAAKKTVDNADGSMTSSPVE